MDDVNDVKLPSFVVYSHFGHRFHAACTRQLTDQRQPCALIFHNTWRIDVASVTADSKLLTFLSLRFRIYCPLSLPLGPHYQCSLYVSL